MARVLVAGIGNVFLGDDGFGVEVAERLRAGGSGPDADVVDYGIRGLHLAYELASGEYEAAILVDAVSRGGAPGDLYAIDPDTAQVSSDLLGDAHGLTPDRVLAWVRMIGGVFSTRALKGQPTPGTDHATRVVIVGCEPETLEPAMELSPRVAAAVEPAVRMVRELIAGLSNEAPACA